MKAKALSNGGVQLTLTASEVGEVRHRILTRKLAPNTIPSTLQLAEFARLAFDIEANPVGTNRVVYASKSNVPKYLGDAWLFKVPNNAVGRKFIRLFRCLMNRAGWQLRIRYRVPKPGQKKGFYDLKREQARVLAVYIERRMYR